MLHPSYYHCNWYICFTRLRLGFLIMIKHWIELPSMCFSRCPSCLPKTTAFWQLPVLSQFFSSQDRAARTQVHHLEAEKWNTSEKKVLEEAFLVASKTVTNTVTLVIISNTLTSEGGSEEAPSLSFSDVSRINHCHILGPSQKYRLHPHHPASHAFFLLCSPFWHFLPRWLLPCPSCPIKKVLIT